MPDLLGRLQDALADRYRLDRELGQGGMATVYRAHDLRNNRPVALKVLRPELAAILGAERFLKEIETTANLQHPHILPLFDSGQAESFLYYVMPYVEGESLRDRLSREKQLPIPEVVRFATEIASALDYAHRHGVLHRDIKPENILLHDGQALVADFGIALAMRKAGGARLTETGLSLGTPQYMSPEQATAERELDARTDVYALGAVTYEMLTGEPPFTGNTTQAIIAKLMTETPRPVSVLRKAVPEAVEAAVLAALEKLPADRFASAAEFTAALSGSASRPTAQSPGRRHAARPPSRLTVYALATTTLLATALAVWGWFRPEPSRPVNRYELSLSSAEAVRPVVFGLSLALSPDGRRLVYVGPGELGGQLWVRDRSKLRSTPLPGTAGAVHPFFSPDGNRIGFIAQDLSVRTMPASGGPLTTLVPSATAQLGGAAWGSDGYIYFDTPTGLERVRETGGSVEVAVPLDTAHGELGHAYPQVLPNGKGLLFRSRRGADESEFDLVVMNLRTRERHVLMRGLVGQYTARGYLVVAGADGTLLAVPFDQTHLALAGPPVPIGDSVYRHATGAAEFSLALDGTLVYLAARNGVGRVTRDLAWVGRDGVATPVRLNPILDASTLLGVAVSPDGGAIAFEALTGAGDHIWVKHLPDGPPVRLTFQGRGSGTPAWSSDGRLVSFSSDSGGQVDLWTMRADGMGQPRLVLRGPEQIWEHNWSPDGRWLIYRTLTSGEHANRNIYAIRPGVDSAPIPLAATPAQETSPVISPNGKWFAYTSDESGRPEIYVRPFPRAEDGKWQVSTGGGSQPLWAHSGRELFYQNAAGDLVAIAVTTSPMFAPGVERAILTGTSLPRDSKFRFYDVSPDDRRFLMVRGAERGQFTSLVVMENWLDELRATGKR